MYSAFASNAMYCNTTRATCIAITLYFVFFQ
jgi:hypothetical protein